MKSQLTKVVFIGAGNVATALAKALPKKYKVIQVYSKTSRSAKKMGTMLKAAHTNDISKVVLSADLYVIAVKDDAIEDIAAKLRLKDKIVIHISGSVDSKVLKKISLKYGVAWPLQSFSKGSILQDEIPFCIEASSSKILKELDLFITELGGMPYHVSYSKRTKLHIAAVFANNFTNHLFGISNQILKKEKLPFDLLVPIINETISKLKNADPFKSQTGPAVRRDNKTIKRHRKILNDNKQFLSVYDVLTQSIQKSSNGKKL